MKHFIHFTARVSTLAITLSLFVAACGGKQTVASKSAEAFREAQQKGTPVGGDGHGGHSAGEGATESAGGPVTMAGMDHSKMDMSGQKSMAGMDHSKMNMGGQKSMAGVDHSKMNMGGQKSMAGMDHSKMDMSGKKSMAGMDHSKMDMGGQKSMAGMHHSKMDMSGQKSMAGMDHSKMSMAADGGMAGMQHGSSGSAEIRVPTTNGEMQRLRPADTLNVDLFDAPVSISVAEAMKTPQGESGDSSEPAMSGHAQHGMTEPAPAGPASPHQTGTPGPEMDHSQHSQPAAVAKPKPRKQTTSRPKGAPAAATVYACPMHPEVTSDKAGSCPKCGMALTKQIKRTTR
ncbi:MAG TPA: heavy metal-binding domain-containing protein [Thermoanaerobaculia bacterium]|nr:heavy metal-binding domain-containing protein [Thermoanaerobaculia bacterium]